MTRGDGPGAGAAVPDNGTYQELPPPIRTNKPAPGGGWTHAAWCSIHDRFPSECFDLHYPEATRGEPNDG